jgi:acyl-CoA dehydrogenase
MISTSTFLLTLVCVIGIPVLILMLPPLRLHIITTPLMKWIAARGLVPRISETEQAALEAGTVGVEREFFTGKPDFDRLRTADYPQLPAEVQAFLAGPVEQVCRMVTDWEIQRDRDLPQAVWDYLKQAGFFGLMIPQHYGGLGFSSLGYSAVITKLASRSFTHVATVGVPNSLGPAKLLLRYGTTAQKDYYLPRLAKGEEIPCFALTEPTAGSDAASLQSRGEVFRSEDGALYLRLNWQKRYITLGAIATLMGLAVRLSDPDNLLGHGPELGITCVLVPTRTPGVCQTHQHDPMGVPFFNAPLAGENVVVPVEAIIGGPEQAGKGWKMIMETLAAGRGISFPATCAGSSQLVARVSGAYAAVRQQFGTPIGKFEGIETPLARIAGLTYLLDAVRLYTVGAVDRGESSAVVAAIAKYQTTELARQVINDGMDILGGAGICRGPHNLLAAMYTATPISITVEGANILTRSLMIFGQGVIRSHPYSYGELQALAKGDRTAFDQVLWAHLGNMVWGVVRTKLLSLTRGRLVQAPVQGEIARYYRRLSWTSSLFATLVDLALLRYGGSLKRHEHLSGRFADVLSWLYLEMATLRRFEAEGSLDEDLPLVHWVMHYGNDQLQSAINGILMNLELPVIGGLMRGPVRAWWQAFGVATPTTDEFDHQVAQIIQTPGVQRDRLTSGIFTTDHPDEAIGRLEQAFMQVVATQPILQRIKQASRSGQLPSGPPEQLLDRAIASSLITAEEGSAVRGAIAARLEAIQVDAFPLVGVLGPGRSQDSNRSYESLLS